MLEVKELRKRYGELVAAGGVSFAVAPGEIVGLLGPNGAGKTTTLSMLSGVLAPDAGEVRWQGRRLEPDGDPARRRFGLVPQELAVYEPLTARENLAFFAALHGLRGRRRDQACERGLRLAGLAARADDRVAGFSGGMKRRLHFACGLLHDPELLLVDEPTVGVDPQSRAFLFDAVEELAARGKAVIYTSHYLEEVERLCHRVVVMDAGRVVAAGSQREIAERFAGEATLVVELAGAVPPAELERLRGAPGVSRVSCEGNVVRAALSDVTSGASGILGALARAGARVRHVATERASLEQAFLALTGKELRDP